MPIFEGYQPLRWGWVMEKREWAIVAGIIAELPVPRLLGRDRPGFFHLQRGNQRETIKKKKKKAAALTLVDNPHKQLHFNKDLSPAQWQELRELKQLFQDVFSSVQTCTTWNKDPSRCPHQLNEISEFDSYPLLRIDDLIERLGEARFISSLD